VHLLLASTERLVPDGSALRAVHRSFLLYSRAMAFDQSQPSASQLDQSRSRASQFDQSQPSASHFHQSQSRATQFDQSRPSPRDQWDRSAERHEVSDQWEQSASKNEDLNAAVPAESAGGVFDATIRSKRDGFEVKNDGFEVKEGSSLEELQELSDVKSKSEESENRDVFEVKDDAFEVEEDVSAGEPRELGDAKAVAEESENQDVFEVKEDVSAGSRSSAERAEL
jgi:hypothetical protein